MQAKLSAAVGVVLLGIGACAGNRAPAASADPAVDAPQTIHVENGMPATLRVFSLVAGSETMMGRVPADGEATLELRVPVTGKLRLVARPSTAITTRAHVSEPIEIMAGQRVTWQLRFSPGASGVPQMSTFSVVPCGESVGC